MVRRSVMKRLKDMIYIALFIIIDQTIKIYIYINHMGKDQVIVRGILSFYPKFNRDFSWINSLFQFGAGLVSHTIVAFIALLIVLISYDYMKTMKYMNKTIWLALILIISGSICSIIDKVAWGGSLDYIYLEGFFIFDLKDVYASAFAVLIILSLILNYNKIKKIDDKKMLMDFVGFFKTKYLRVGMRDKSEND